MSTTPSAPTIDSAIVGARTVYTLDPAETAARDEARRAAMRAGALRLEGSLEGASSAMRGILVELHNRLARRTA